MRDSILIDELRIDCIVGIYPAEREREQPVLVTLDAKTDTQRSGLSCQIEDTIDYDRLAAEIDAIMRFRRYHLLETAAEEISAMILGIHTRVSDISLTLKKPLALAGRAKNAGVRVHRCRSDLQIRRETSPFGYVDVLLETEAAGLYLLHIPENASIPRHHHEKMRELEWPVAGRILRDESEVTGFSPITWPLGQVHQYRNAGTGSATIFCCDSPPFDRSDEILALAPGDAP